MCKKVAKRLAVRRKSRIFAENNSDMANYVRFDWAMKRLLRDKANHAVLEGLMTSLLGERFTIVRFLESEGNQTDETDKFNRVDMLVENERGELVIIEIQNSRELTYFHRMLYGVSKVITDYIKIGDDYGKGRKVYSVNIVYFSIGQGTEYVYHRKMVFRGLHDSNDVLRLSKRQQEAFFGIVDDTNERKEAGDLFPEYYLLKVNNFDRVAKTPLDEWIAFLKTGEISADTTVPGLVEARECLNLDKMSEADRHAYMRHMDNIWYQKNALTTSFDDGMRKGRAEGRAEGEAIGLEKGEAIGLEKGKKLEKLETARNLKSLGVPIETIATATGLSTDEINSL